MKLILPLALLLALGEAARGAAAAPGPLDPRGKVHIPIGIPDTLDGLKTFVEAEGCFSPGFATYGIYFWIYDSSSGKLAAPTMEGVKCERGLELPGLPIPWTTWETDELSVKTEVCEVRRESPAGEVLVVGARVHMPKFKKSRKDDSPVFLYVALRGLGPAGGPVRRLEVSPEEDALLADGHPAVVACEKPSGAGVLPEDRIGDLALRGEMPKDRSATSPGGECSGALRFELGRRRTMAIGLIFPVLPGRRAVPHRWDGKSPWAQLDEAAPNPAEGGVLQPDPGLEYYRRIPGYSPFTEARKFWQDFLGRRTIRLPDRWRWTECFGAITAHAALCMNEGAPDVSVVNYNVYNRDGVYIASILQKSGRFDLAERAIDHFLAHPFSGRSYPEADNPGQVLWILGEHWLFTRSRIWLEKVYPSERKIASLIEYLRTTPGPHWVGLDSLEFGEKLPQDLRRELKPGACDGFHPEYTEAFDIAGLRAAALLAKEIGDAADLERWEKLAASLLAEYDRKFGDRLPREYGSYSVLWPCRLYPLESGKAHEQFQGIGAQKPQSWRYFPLATAHQGLLAGNRAAAWETIETHLDHEQMRGWYAFDEGGKSGSGGWRHARTTWNGDVAMPHGWAIAEMHLLLRDSLLYEDGGRLVILAGVPPKWFLERRGMKVEGLPCHFGAVSFSYSLGRDAAAGKDSASLVLSGAADPPGGFVLPLPFSPSFVAGVTADGKPIARKESGSILIPRGTKEVKIEFAEGKDP